METPAIETPDTYRLECIYTDADGRDVGASFVHRATGLSVRALAIESVPQVFVHVWTPPTSDMGEPHTGEHLLLGKGTKGKSLAAAEEMSLVESTAYTAQTDVCYSFNCAAGPDTFFRTLERMLDALLFPSYDDDEIRREVRHLAAVRDPHGGLELEEKGTVYNEMVASDEKRWIVFREVSRRLYGEGHPLANVAGGTPAGIRTLTPEQVRRFHRDHYHPSNMGLIVALPPHLPSDVFLTRLDTTLTEFAARDPDPGREGPELELPPPRTAPDRSLLRVPYPNPNEQDTGHLVLAWPPRPAGTLAQHLLRSLMLEAFADGETSLLHRVLLDSSTRRLEVQASRVWSDLDSTPVGEEASLGFTGFAAREASEESVRAIERAVREELDQLAARGAGDDALAAFGDRVETGLRELERSLKRRLSSPPLFGRRGGGGGFWLEHLRLVDRGGGARRSLVLREAVEEARARLRREANPWGAVIDELGLRDAPVIGVSYPSADEIKRRAIEREERIAAELQRLQLRHSATTPQEALEHLAAQDRAVTTRLRRRDAGLEPVALVADLPLGLDEELRYERGQLSGVPTFRAHFAAMSAVEVSLSFRLEGVQPDELVLLPVLPQLLVSAGLRSGDGQRLLYHELRDRLEREVGGLVATYDLRPETSRHELRLTGSGADLSEARLALHWLQRCLLETDLSPENLPRLRDLTLQRARDQRGMLGRSEEGWVRNPAAALRFQHDLLYRSAGSIHARLLHLWRLGWLLTEPPRDVDARRAAALFSAARFLFDRDGPAEALVLLGKVVEAGRWPEELAPPELLQVLPTLREPEAEAFLRGVTKRVIEGLSELRQDLPPGTERADMARLLGILAGDLSTEPSEVLERLGQLTRLLRAPSLRLVLTGRAESLRALEPELSQLVEALQATDRPAGDTLPRPEAPVAERLAARGVMDPAHFGLVNPGSSSGVFVFSAGLGAPLAADREALLDLLAASVDAGGGPHGFFMRTWGAGLAYSNGLRASAIWGRASYYAERCPDPVATMRYVIELAKEPASGDLLDYALVQLVSAHRMADRFETRARAQAADFEDGVTPERVRAQRRALLALRGDPEVWREVQARREAVAGRVLVGLGAPTSSQPQPVFLTIAPERLLAEWESYVHEVEGAQAHVARLYPADLWVWGES